MTGQLTEQQKGIVSGICMALVVLQAADAVRQLWREAGPGPDDEPEPVP